MTWLHNQQRCQIFAITAMPNLRIWWDTKL